ncbi:WecB/TagA/CpsF family glycosyltransferase [Pacificoceanicola onchidii]|uniref:WecB/TagA/CpsF family glycosyltransferase n=1 Tax=Pacificoceanicola onchidii TaxID=2562685 RepID=UPI0010A688EB|nr:WecB/TagA/CpsF family glycosyltransferase [Pacificoceanicola onchidii]
MLFTIKSQTINVNVPTWDDLESRVEARLRERSGFSLATINLDHLVKLNRSSVFRDAYQRQDFVVADGNPIVWMSKLAKQPVELIPGSDAILPLAKVAARNAVPVAFVGSTAESLASAKAFLETEVPGLEVALCISPPMGFDPLSEAADEVLRQVEASGAGLCFVALGAPKQEVLSARGRTVAPTVGFASIGAGLDFFAGSQKRAPDWARRYALEWMWRMLGNPRRLGVRYLKCLLILPGQVVQALALRARNQL